MKPRMFITQPVAASVLERLAAHFTVTVHPDPLRTISKADLLAGVKDQEYLFCRLGDEVDADVIAAGNRLKLVATLTTRPVGYDLRAATARGIPVMGYDVAPERPGVTLETADLTWALLLAVARRILEGDRLVRAGIFPGPHSPYLLGAQVHGKRLGIVGMGRIGRAVAKRAWGFDMAIDYHSRQRHPEVEEAFGATWRPLEELLAGADFVCLLPAYTPETHHLIAEAQLRRMKPTAFLVNTSRGPVVKLAALVEALLEKRIAGAALDVLEGEPHPELPQALIDLPSVVLTPHIGSAVAEKREAMFLEAADQIIAVFKGGRPGNCFNPEVLEGR